MRIAILMYWETAVEIPAPRTPSLRTKIRKISPKMFKIPPEAKHCKKGFSLVSENVIHNAAGCHGRCCDQDPGAVFDGVRKDGIGTSQEMHEG